MKSLKPTTLLGGLLVAFAIFALAIDSSTNNKKENSYAYLDTELNNAMTYTLEVIEGFPADDFGYKPGEEMRSFGAQAYHIAYSLEWFNAQLSGAPIQWNPGDEDRMNKEELTNYVTEQFEVLLQTIQSAEESGEFTAGILGVLRHNSHHRGQMVAYYRANNLVPPSYK